MKRLHAQRRSGTTLLAVASGLALLSCDLEKILKNWDASGPAFDSTALAISSSEITLGASATLTVTAPADLANTTVRWTSSDTSKVKIDSVTGTASGLAIGIAKVTVRVLAPEMAEGVAKSQDVRVRYKGVRVTAPIATDSLTGLGQTRRVIVQGSNNAGVVQPGALSTGVVLTSTDSTVFRIRNDSVVARQSGSARIVAVFDTFRDSVLFRVRQVAKSITFPTPDFTATAINANLAVPLVVRDVADSIIPAPALTWRVNDTTVATVGVSTGVLRVKRIDTTRVFAKMDTVERGQRIVVAQQVASLTKSAGDNLTDTVALPIATAPTVTAVDAGGTAVPNAQVTFRVGSGGGKITDSVKTTSVTGIAALGSWTLGDLAGVNTVVATSGSTAITFAAIGVAGAPKKLAFVAHPSPAPVGGAINPAITVAVQDSLGNVATNATNSITLSIAANPGGATLGGIVTASAANGIATCSGITVSASGAGYQLQASATALTPVLSNGFDVFAAPTKLAFTTQPTSGTAGTTLPIIRVSVQDANGVTVTNAPQNITMAIGANPGSSPALGGTTTVQTVAGVAAFSTLVIANAGSSYTLQATAPSLTSATSNAFNVVAPPPATKLAFTAQPSTIVAGALISPAIQVTVQDASGATVTSSAAQITIAIDPAANPGSAIIGGSPIVSAISGVATFNNINLNKAGVGYRLTASASALTSATSSTFNVTVGAATKLGFVQHPTNAVVGQTILPAPSVAIQDANGNTVTTAPAASVSLSLGSCVATLGGTTAVNTSSGVATYGTLSIATQVSNCFLTATASGLTPAQSAVFSVVAPTPPTTIVSGLTALRNMAVTGSTVLWVEQSNLATSGTGTLRRVDVGGGAITTMAAGLISPLSVVSDGANVFWMEQGDGSTRGALKRMPIGGGAITTLASDLMMCCVASEEAAWSHIKVDDTNIYFISVVGSGIALRKVPKGGGAITDLFNTGANTGDINKIPYFTIHAGVAYVSDGTNVRSVPTSGGTPTTLSNILTPRVLAVLADRLYIVRSSGEFSSYTLAGGGGTLLGQFSAPLSIASDGTDFLFVAEGPGRIWRYAQSSGALTQISGVTTGGSVGLAVAGLELFWTDNSAGPTQGKIQKVSK